LFTVVAVKDVLVAKRKGLRYNLRNCLVSYGMMLPAVVLTFIFVLLPIIYSLGYAFTDFYLLKPNNIKFSGLENFKQIIDSVKEKGDMYNAIINTAKFVVGVVPLQIGLALGLALFVNNQKKGTGVLKICYFAPVVISLSVTSYLWLQILSPSEDGLLNMFLGFFGVKPKHFLLDKDLAMPCIILMSAWQGCGYQMLIFLSGLTNIRKELYEAAALDGATGWGQFLHVTVPGLRSTFLFVVVTVFVGACRVMVQPMLLTGYMEHTVTLSYFMYHKGYESYNVGYSSAVALLMTIVMGTITFLQRRFLSERD
jgi:fructooligosaccharide transport system permease protein